MSSNKYLPLILCFIVINTYPTFSQELKNIFLGGAGFGQTYPIIPDLKAKERVIGRLLMRYHFERSVAVEGGLCLGVVEAKGNPYFFSSLVIPADVRLILQPPFLEKLSPYFGGGVGMMYFDPVDEFNKPLVNNARGEYNRITPFLPITGGIQYFFAENTAIELNATHYFTMTKYLDDVNKGKTDNYWVVAINLLAFLGMGELDPDRDGLTNREEKELGTNSRNPDTDGDGLKDGEEVKIYYSNPLKKDSDDDELTDYEEVLKYKTNPNNKDTDDDDLTDGEEVLRYNTNPLNKDTDGDGCTDGDEVLISRTNPLNPDTDGDGLTDCDEKQKYRTDPLRQDTDNDGCTDGEEVLQYKTNPLFADTDGGGMPDCQEVQLGLNTFDPRDDVPHLEVGQRIILEGVNFETAKTVLLPESKIILDRVVKALQLVPTMEVIIEGHTDNVGSARYNLNLSNGRAEAVKDYLVSKGISPHRLKTKGFGFTKPIADNETPEGRAKNRRVEFSRIK